MFSEYVEKAMRKATYELIEDGTFFGEIPGFAGVWGNAPTLEKCRDELKSTLEEWLVLKLWDHDDDIPSVGRLSLIPRRARLPKEHGTAPPQRSRKAS
ncbi:MAG TPA: type II toxin-antitoxin system HicB family antitoxin [Dehalococcoidia bacterium]|nr:type II toxin-antitoxin system HicB family antitoxin [Dehalococcoidia bacterium]